MSTASTLHYDEGFKPNDRTLQEIVKEASEVIVPLGDINNFAARSPWAGLEHQTFDQVARRLKDTGDIDMYPNHAIVSSAARKGEIDLAILEEGLNAWLDEQLIGLPRELAKEYCRNVLQQESNSFTKRELPGAKTAALWYSKYFSPTKNKHSILTMSQRVQQPENESLVENINLHVIKWCKLYLDESLAVWSMPNKEAGFYAAWRQMARYDRTLTQETRKQLDQLNQNAEQALMEVLHNMDIPNTEWQEYLEAHLLALPGWAGMIRSREEESEALLLEYLAMRLSLEYVFVKEYLPLPEPMQDDVQLIEKLLISWIEFGRVRLEDWAALEPEEITARLMLANRFNSFVQGRLWLEAWEKTYEKNLQECLPAKPTTIEEAKTIAVQFAFCIDVRSETFRRHLERSGPFETFGTAGFFGLPIETNELASSNSHNSLPIMFKPSHKVLESTDRDQLEQYIERAHTAHSVGKTFKTMKQNMLTSLLLPEISGPWLSIQTLARSFIPQKAGEVMRQMSEKWLKKPMTKLTLHSPDEGAGELPVGFTEEEQVFYVRQALQTMSLTENFAPLVVICGHGSQSRNNPYASALDCGACGGASSQFNARVLATLCNLSNVRETLAKEGIHIPEDTVFAAAEHITSLDELKFTYLPELPVAAKNSFELIQGALPTVRKSVNAERLAQLPTLHPDCPDPEEEVRRFADDWSEVRPEWGLARNAGFIIGERTLTEDCDLEGRVFLQNYQWQLDPTGDILASIIAGPALVAQWINLQYYASTVAPHYYGSGNKATQTITAGVGVMQGNASDLLFGLPWQSVMMSDEEAYHAPIRLLVVVQAPKYRVQQILEQNAEFRQKLQNGWIRLSCIDPDGIWHSFS